MANKLIIVESPAKVHTIQKFLGSGYKVIASQGHVRDLPKSRLGVDVDNGFEPQYITIRGKGEIMAALKKELKKADKVYLATDPDREGEAISWHLTEALNMSGKEVHRITFNEITKNAVKEALKKPSTIDIDLVNAQQARRVLDRVVGYQLSPILWKKVKGKLSAGRVQSAVLRLICDREKEINAFVPEEFWTLNAILENGKSTVRAEYYGEKDKKVRLTGEKQVEKILSEVNGLPFDLTELKESKRVKNAPAPFTTSTLQQEASSRLNYSTQKTMRLAQQLYEGVPVSGRGTMGLITYLRTDSTRISAEADEACKSYIAGAFGEEMVGKGIEKTAARAQDAHEAIRPADVTLTPEMLKDDLSRDLFRLYQLIWKRFVASRMKAAVYETAQAKFMAGNHVFTAPSSVLVFPGFYTVYEGDGEKNTGEAGLKKLTEGMELTAKGIEKEQHFTQPPAHYTEASLVRAMEEFGLGRPSTYAPTITNILSRHYITKEGKNLFVTELGDVVNTMMETSFPDIVDIGFTADMETKLDEIAEGKLELAEMMKDFYPNFAEELTRAEQDLQKVKIEDQVSDVPCDKCGRMMVYKFGPHGRFLACPGFPECRNTKPLLEKSGDVCPQCGKDIVIRRTKSGRRFYACEGAPECEYMSWTKPGK